MRRSKKTRADQASAQEDGTVRTDQHNSPRTQVKLCRTEFIKAVLVTTRTMWISTSAVKRVQRHYSATSTTN